MFWEQPVTVRVPATTANLGPGFDALGMALGLHDELTLAIASTGTVVEVEGEGAGEVPLDDTHLVVRALRAAFDRMGVPMPGLVLRCTNRIPHARGLGSSSAAIVAGAVLARGVLVEGDLLLPDDDLLDLVVSLEGHPDNVAPCLLGGLVVAWADDADGRARAASIPVADRLSAVALVPDEPVSTELARSLLPASVPHADAAANGGRTALLVHALSRDPSLLLAGTRDRLHQDARASAMPRSHALVGALRAAGLPAVISGAGPTVLVLRSPSDGGDDPLEAVLADHPGFARLDLPVDRDGARLVQG